MLASTTSATRCSISLRSRGVSAAQAGNAAAAALDRGVDVGGADWPGTEPMTSPVAGLMTSSVAPSAAGRQSPPMKFESSRESEEDSVGCHRPQIATRADPAQGFPACVNEWRIRWTTAAYVGCVAARVNGRVDANRATSNRASLPGRMIGAPERAGRR